MKNRHRIHINAVVGVLAVLWTSLFAWAQEVPHNAAAGYDRLAAARAAYARQVANGWAPISSGPKLAPGDRGPRVAELRRRLEAEGFLRSTANPEAMELFDDHLTAAVTAYQERHGLEADGAVGKATLAALNVPAHTRLCQLDVNLARFAAEPPVLPERYIRVNIPDFRLAVIEGNAPVLEMKVVVGRPGRKTPIFDDEITSLVINPAWFVPRKIALLDKLPQIRNDPGYLAKHHMRLVQGVGEEAVDVDPTAVDWTAVSADNFAWRIIQNPGDDNALGEIKFLLPNPYDVYLHDTSERHLFQRAWRAYSSGCVRVERPVELAAWLLRDDPAWPKEQILSAIRQGTQRGITLATPVPVRLVYVTAWAGSDGALHFREDLYKRDAKEGKALCTPPTRQDVL